MKKLVYILIFLSFGCQKANMKGFRIWNDAESTLSIYTDEKTHKIEPKTSQFFTTKTPKLELKYRFDDENLKVKINDYHTDQAHIRVGSYIYDFRMTIAGSADSAYYYVNGLSFKQKLPIEYGLNNLDSYQASIKPINGKESTWIQIFVNGTLKQRFESVNNESCILTGKVNTR